MLLVRRSSSGARSLLGARRRLSNAILPSQPALANYLEGLCAKHADIEKTLADASTSFSADRMRELSRLSPIVAARDDALALAKEVAELRILKDDKEAQARIDQQ